MFGPVAAAAIMGKRKLKKAKSTSDKMVLLKKKKMGPSKKIRKPDIFDSDGMPLPQFEVKMPAETKKPVEAKKPLEAKKPVGDTDIIYKCKVCPAKFTRRFNRDRHMELVHKVARPEKPPLYPDHLAAAAQPKDIQKAVETQQPMETEKPMDTQEPVETPKPVETEKVVETPKPKETPKEEVKAEELDSSSDESSEGSCTSDSSGGTSSGDSNGDTSCGEEDNKPEVFQGVLTIPITIHCNK